MVKKKTDRILLFYFIAGARGCCYVVTCDGMTHTEEVFCSSFFVCALTRLGVNLVVSE